MEYSYIREDFDITLISKRILSIQISLDGFSFVINSIEENGGFDYIYIKTIDTATTESLIDELTKFTGFDLKEFYAIRIMLLESRFALIPETFFDLQDMKTYLKFNHPPKVKTKNISNRIPATKAVCAFSVDEELYDLLRKKYPGADFYHTSLPFCSMAVSSGIDGCFVQVYQNSLEIAIVISGKLMLYNIFEYQNENDIVYFILNAYKSASISTLTNPLIIAGILPAKSDVVTIAGKYIKDISFYKMNSIILPDSDSNHYVTHYFLNHKEILICEL